MGMLSSLKEKLICHVRIFKIYIIWPIMELPRLWYRSALFLHMITIAHVIAATHKTWPWTIVYQDCVARCFEISCSVLLCNGPWTNNFFYQNGASISIFADDVFKCKQHCHYDGFLLIENDEKQKMNQGSSIKKLMLLLREIVNGKKLFAVPI